MVRILALLLALFPTSALAQATFTTVISPTTLGTSPLAVTFGSSPFGVICVSGCSGGGASPSTVIASLTTSAPYVQQGTSPWTVTSSTSPVGVAVTNSVLQVNVAGGSTLPVSANGPLFIQTVSASLTTSAPYVNINTIPTVTTSGTSQTFVQQGTNPWVISGTVTPAGSPAAVVQTSGFTNVTSPLAVIATSAFVSNIGPAITFADSLTTASGPTAVAGFSFLWNGTNWDRTVGTSKLGAYVNVTNNGSTFTVAPTTSPLAVTLPLSPITVAAVNSAAVTNVSAAGTSPLAVTLSSSPTAIAEQNGLAYPNRANWKQGSVTTTGTASAVVIGAPAANKLYITALQCWRSDAGTSPMIMRFNDPAAQFTVSVGSNQVNMVLNPALVMSATTSLQFSASTSLTSVGCNAQGYNNP